MLIVGMGCNTGKAVDGNALIVRLAEFSPDPSGRESVDEGLEQALDRIRNHGSGTLLIPTGRFRVMNRHFIPSNTHIKGEGQESIFYAGDESGKPRKIPGGGMFLLHEVENITVEAIQLDLNTPSNYATLLQFRDVKNITIENCFFENTNRENADSKWTLHGIESRNAYDLKVLNNYSNGCQFKLCGAIGSAVKVLVEGNRMENCAQMGVSVVAIPKNGSVSTLRDITIINNKFTRIDDDPIYLGFDKGKGIPEGRIELRDVLVADNTMEELGYLDHRNWYGILVRATEDTENITITNNRILNEIAGKFSYGISVRYSGKEGAYCRNIKVTDNEVVTADHGAITLNCVVNGEISGNNCRRGNRGIEVLNCQNTIVSDNLAAEGKNGIHVQNSTNIEIKDNRLFENTYGVRIEAKKTADRTVLITSGNEIVSGAKNAVGLFSTGAGMLLEEHRDNRIDAALTAFRKDKSAVQLQRTVNGKKQAP